MKIFLCLLLLAIFGNMQSLFACSCFGTESLISSVINNDVIFVGKVVHIEKVETFRRAYIPQIRAFTKHKHSSGSYMHVSLEVVKLFKGIKGTDTMLIRTGLGTDDCGFPFQEGETYIVHANYVSNKEHGKMSLSIETNICLKTKEFNIKDAARIEEILSQYK